MALADLASGYVSLAERAVPVLAIIALSVILSFALFARPLATLKVAVSHTAAARQLDNGQTGTFFNGWVNNRSQETAVYTIGARTKSGAPLTLKGQLRAELVAGRNQRLDFVLLTPTNAALTVEFVLTDKEGLELSVAEAYIGM